VVSAALGSVHAAQDGAATAYFEVAMDIPWSWQSILPPLNASGIEVWLYFFLALVALAALIGWIVLPFALLRMRPLLKEVLAETRKTNQLLEQAFGGGPAAPRDPGTEWIEPTLDGGRKAPCPNCETLIPLATLKCPRCGVRLKQQDARSSKPHAL
jgi:hypothetical protein